MTNDYLAAGFAVFLDTRSLCSTPAASPNPHCVLLDRKRDLLTDDRVDRSMPDLYHVLEFEAEALGVDVVDAHVGHRSMEADAARRRTAWDRGRNPSSALDG